MSGRVAWGWRPRDKVSGMEKRDIRAPSLFSGCWLWLRNTNEQATVLQHLFRACFRFIAAGKDSTTLVSIPSRIRTLHIFCPQQESYFWEARENGRHQHHQRDWWGQVSWVHHVGLHEVASGLYLDRLTLVCLCRKRIPKKIPQRKIYCQPLQQSQASLIVCGNFR